MRLLSLVAACLMLAYNLPSSPTSEEIAEATYQKLNKQWQKHLFDPFQTEKSISKVKTILEFMSVLEPMRPKNETTTDHRITIPFSKESCRIPPESSLFDQWVQDGTRENSPSSSNNCTR
jgi:hypothetical protein